MTKIDRLKDIFMNLRQEAPYPQVSKRDREFLFEVGSKDIAIAQHKILEAGVDTSELWRLWQQNTKILPDQTSKLRRELSKNHFLRRILAEHEMMLCYIADLEELNAEIQKMAFASSVKSEIRKLAEIVRYLMVSEHHREREEDIVYPELVRHGYTALSQIINQQHYRLSERHAQLKHLVWKIDEINFDYFKKQLNQIVEFLVPTMRIHIFIENNLIFPLALEVIKDPKTWRRMKSLSDEIGYYHFKKEE